MLHEKNLSFIILGLLAILKPTQNECIQSYILKCENFDDFSNFKNSDSVSEVFIGSENSNGNLTTVDLMHSLEVGKYYKLTTLMVVNALKGLEVKDYAFHCSYDNSPLQTIIFYGNILKILKFSFLPTVALKKLSLRNNQIEEIKGGTFQNHPIESIDLSDNLLDVIQAGSLPLNAASKIVTIKNNKITHIEPKSFSDSLESFNLDFNLLTYIQDEVFETFENLKELTLSHNKLNTFPKIEHLKRLVIFDISHNSISNLKEGIFKDMDNLKVIDLSNNQIANSLILKIITTPEKQPKLIINLALNRLDEIVLDGFTLQENKVVLYGNPFSCEKWTQLKLELKGHESECDLEFLSNGTVPYCINYKAGNYYFVTMWEQDIENLHNIVKKSEEEAKCELTPKKNKWLYSIGFGCVA